MEPGNATRSKCEPLLSVFEGSGGTHCERASAVWRERGEVESTWGAQNLRKCIVGPTKIDVGGVGVSRLPKVLTRRGPEAP